MTTRKQIEATAEIRQILARRGSACLSRVKNVRDVRELPLHEREEIVCELADEFCEKGLLPNSEPNQYGLRIEELIDACGLAWEKPR